MSLLEKVYSNYYGREGEAGDREGWEPFSYDKGTSRIGKKEKQTTGREGQGRKSREEGYVQITREVEMK
jgi:hypothetical protein